MIWLRVELCRKPLDVLACHALFRTLEAHPDAHIVEPLDHPQAPLLIIARTTVELAGSSAGRSRDTPRTPRQTYPAASALRTRGQTGGRPARALHLIERAPKRRTTKPDQR